MTEEAVFLVQALGIVGVGSLIGELHRSSIGGFSVPLGNMIANYLANTFISLIIAYTIFHYTNNRPFSIIAGALLSYQDDKFLGRVSRAILSKLLDNSSDIKHE